MGNVMTQIDGQAVKELLTKDGATLVSYDREMGYADGFLNTCLRRDNINNVAMKFLTNKGFNLTDYVKGEVNTISHSAKVEIDDSVIEDYIKAHNMTKKAFSQGIGRGRSWVSNVLTDIEPHRISRVDYVAIKDTYGIDVAKNATTEKIKPQAHKIHVKDNRNVTELTADELSRLIYKSVYSATIKANEMLKK